jgi:putative flavoprotein involved in K+ transport
MGVVAPCIVVGAGPAGLGTAAELVRFGVKPLVLDRGDRAAPSWHARYDGFRLNTSSWFSYLPGSRFPRGTDRWPSRDDLVAYYEAYAQEHRLRVRLNTEAERIDRHRGAWRLTTREGTLDAGCVVVATGKYNQPQIPDWDGADGFPGEIVHSARYRNAEPYKNKRVLVVGAGASGFEIATQVSESGAKAWLSIRTPPHIIHRDIGPLPSDAFAVLGRRLPVSLVDRIGAAIRRLSLGDLSRYGLDSPPDGIYTRLKTTGMIPTVDGPYLAAVKGGQVEIVSAVDRFEGNRVLLSDERRLNPEVVIAATGYRRNLEPLVGHLGVLESDGTPAVHGAKTHSRAPRLHFIGFTEPLSGNLRELRLDARKIAKAVAREAR